MVLNYNNHFFEVPSDCSVFAEKSTVIITGAFSIPFNREDMDRRIVVFTLYQQRSAKMIAEQIAEGLEQGLSALTIMKITEWDVDYPFGFKVDRYI